MAVEKSELPPCREFFLQDDGIPLHMKLDVPGGREKYPLVIAESNKGSPVIQSRIISSSVSAV